MKAEYLNHYLTDQDVANYARQSFSKLAENFTKEQNDNLIRFLARGMQSKDWISLINQLINKDNALSYQDTLKLATYLREIPKHWVPFGHPHITLKMSAPVSIRVQCFKHKIGFVESEESRRYISSTPDIYVPAVFRQQSINKKQGSGDTHEQSDYWKAAYNKSCQLAINTYQEMIANGVCAEQARFVLPQGCEVNWVWTGSLYGFSNFYNQRSDAHAQKEIQYLAKEVNEIIGKLYPVSWSALTQGCY